MFDFVTSEGVGRRVAPKVACWGLEAFWWEKVVQEGLVDGDRVGGAWEGGKSGSFPWGDGLFGRPDVLEGRFG